MIGFQCQQGRRPEAHRSVLRKSSRCQCGCRRVVHATRSFVEWSACSHRSLAAGTRPTQRHHGAEGGALPLEQPWPGRSLPAHAASRPARTKMTSVLSVVVASGASGLAGMDMLVWGCPKKTTDKHFAATRALIAGSLDDDRDSRRARGKALRIDLARLGLYKRDRLEPSGEVLV